MSQWEKLISRILSLSKDVRFNELKRILESYGYTVKQSGTGSSHYVFRKPGSMPITIPKHEPIKIVYIQLVKEIIEKENENEQSK